MQDNDSSKVVSFKTRKPLIEQQAAEAELEKAAAIVMDEIKVTTINSALKAIDFLRDQVADGKLNGVIVIARDPVTKLFYSDVIMHAADVPAEDCWAYAGILGGLAMEMNDCAMMGKAILTGGAIIDPIEERNNELDEEDE